MVIITNQHAIKNNIKYKLVHRPDYLGKLGECMFKRPGIYLSFLACVSVFIILFPPHVVIFKDTNQEESNEVQYYDWNNEKGFERTIEYSDIESSPYTNLIESFPNLLQANDEPPKCSGFKDNERFDCFPELHVTEDMCIARGCCWSPTSKGQLKGVPYCYYPTNFKSYKYVNVTESDFGKHAFLQLVKNSSYPDNIDLVTLEVNYIKENVLQIKFYDARNARYETTFPKISTIERCSVNTTEYVVNIDTDHFGFNIVRKSNNQSIFNTQAVGGFIFADQMLQLSARLPSNRLYGLGQRRNDFQLDMNWNRIALFNHDTPPADKLNLYGSHPFYLTMEDNGLSSAVLLLNSNAMDVILQPMPAITYRAIGGVLDFYVFTGPSPADVIRQYTQLIGRPFMPPYWSLGFHLCRYGYNSLNNMVTVWNRTRAAGIPLDTQWNDIDAMDNFKDFTYDKKAFNGLPDFVKTLHKEGMHYVIMTDPGQSAGEPRGSYPPYDDMIKTGVYLKDPNEDKPFVTKVWNPNGTVFPDFFHPDAQTYWDKQIKQFHNTIDFDGLWIDMNDPSTVFSGGKNGCESNKYDNPPYMPAVHGGKLCTNTVCMSARHHNARHYDVHNIFASQEAVLTARALQNVRNKRPFVISRSSFPGHGHFTGVWTGDIYSSWDDMSHSIADILSFSLFGIPMVGADICGFNGNTTAALCRRWVQLGAFYPFARNHNDASSSDQDPVALGPGVVEAARKALLTRYSLLPYLYTLFWRAHTRGDTVARPMFVQFPADDKTYTLYSQFLWGPALLIAPLLTEEKTYAKAYLPAGRWYDFYLYKPISSKGSTYLLPTSSDNIPLMLYGGHIVPTQRPNVTTTASRKNPLGLIVALCPDGNATGDLYWDDGDTLDHEKKVYNYIRLSVSVGKLSSAVDQWNYQTSLQLAEVKVLGVEWNVTKVNVDGAPAHFSFSSAVKMLNVPNLTVDLSKPFTLTWE